MLLYAFPIATFGLGTWQVYRLQLKRTLIREAEDALNQSPVPLETLSTPPSDLLVEIQGSFDDTEFHLGPRVLDGEGGVHVVAPFTLSSGDRLLVNRGWVHRDQLHTATRFESLTNQKLVGLLKHGIQRPSWSPENQPLQNQWYWADLDRMSQLGNTRPVLVEVTEPVSSLADSAHRSKLGVPVPKPRTVTLTNNHLQYAVTWYALSAATTAMLLFRRRGRVTMV